MHYFIHDWDVFNRVICSCFLKFIISILILIELYRLLHSLGLTEWLIPILYKSIITVCIISVIQNALAFGESIEVWDLWVIIGFHVTYIWVILNIILEFIDFRLSSTSWFAQVKYKSASWRCFSRTHEPIFICWKVFVQVPRHSIWLFIDWN